MGVKATLLGITLTAADITQAETLGVDVKGLMTTAGAKCDDLKQLLGVIINDVRHHQRGDADHADQQSVVVWLY